MISKANEIEFMNEKFQYVKTHEGKLIYESIKDNLNQVKILEIVKPNESQKLEKIDIYTFENDEIYESIHIIRGIDGIVEIDYYPENYEYVNVNGKKDHYNMSIYATYKENNNNFYQEILELDLTRKGNKKHKILTKLSNTNSLYVTKQNKYFNINSHAINKFKNYSELIIESLKKPINLLIEESKEKKEIKNNNSKKIKINKTQNLIPTPTLDVEIEENDDFFEEEERILESTIDNYPSPLYVYDRNYDLIGITKQAVIYRNTEDDITELEIYLNNNKTQIKEIRFVYYKQGKIDETLMKSKRKIIRIMKDSDNKIIASLCNRKKESIRLNGNTIEKVKIKAEAIVNENNKFEDIEVTIQYPMNEIEMKKSPTFGVDFIGKDNMEYNLSSYSYVTFRTLVLFSRGIINNLEKNIIFSKKEEESEKKLLMKK